MRATAAVHCALLHLTIAVLHASTLARIECSLVVSFPAVKLRRRLHGTAPGLHQDLQLIKLLPAACAPAHLFALNRLHRLQELCNRSSGPTANVVRFVRLNPAYVQKQVTLACLCQLALCSALDGIMQHVSCCCFASAAAHTQLTALASQHNSTSRVSHTTLLPCATDALPPALPAVMRPAAPRRQADTTAG